MEPGVYDTAVELFDKIKNGEIRPRDRGSVQRLRRFALTFNVLPGRRCPLRRHRRPASFTARVSRRSRPARRERRKDALGAGRRGAEGPRTRRRNGRSERPMKPDARYAVQMSGIVKTFGTFTALDHVDLTVQKGTIHAVLGENGAGKSTLMNVLYGLYQADEGQICLNGEPVVINTPNDAIAHGIGMVHQHFMLVDNFTVTQNIVLGSEVCGAAGILDMKKAREKVCQIIEQYGLEVDPDAKIEDISVGMQQRVEILKALYRGADILILDEPTAVLTPQEIDRLIQIMHDLTSAGKTIIVITHKLKEIKASSTPARSSAAASTSTKSPSLTSRRRTSPT
ncbi:MAG: ATP-binding cassette domain-containing protein [Collinsella intestinalis]